MKKYRIREGSIADLFRYAVAGFAFGILMAAIMNSAYPFV